MKEYRALRIWLMLFFSPKIIDALLANSHKMAFAHPPALLEYYPKPLCFRDAQYLPLLKFRTAKSVLLQD